MSEMRGRVQGAVATGMTIIETRDLFNRLDKYPVYGLLFVPDENHPFAKMITRRWDDLHHMTGDKFLVVAFQPPDTFSREFKSWWEHELGQDFDGVWSKWQEKRSAHIAYDFDEMFEQRKVRRTEMPCLALFTLPLANRAAILRIPDWSDEDVWKFLEGVCDAIDECASEPNPETRLSLLESSLTSLPARAKRKLGYLAEKAEIYVGANPVKVTITTISVLIALSTANIMPIGVAGVAFMKDIVKILKPE